MDTSDTSDTTADDADVVRVLVVDDHETFTDLVRLALDAEPDLECVGAAHDPEQARSMVRRLRPDVVLMDVDLGEVDGLTLTAELLERDPDQRVVVLTAFADARVMRRAATVGACALLPKGGSLRDLLACLRHARQGELYVHPRLLRSSVLESGLAQDGPAPPPLTPREDLVLQLLAEGHPVLDIARELGISVHTCRGYVKALLAKLGAHSQLEAVAIATRQGYLGAGARRV